MKANTSSYDAVDKCSPKQQICDNASISFMVRKNWAYTPTASGSYGRLAGWQAVRLAGCKAGRLSDEIRVDSRRFEKSLQVKLMKIFTLLTPVQCYYSVRNAFRRLF